MEMLNEQRFRIGEEGAGACFNTTFSSLLLFVLVKFFFARPLRRRTLTRPLEISW